MNTSGDSLIRREIVVIEPQFSGVGGFSEGLTIVQIDPQSGMVVKTLVGYKYGVIDTKGNVVINPQFDKAYSFSEGIGGRKNWGRLGQVGIH